MSLKTVMSEEVDFGSDLPEFSAPGDGGNLRCNWDEAVCSESAEYRLEYAPLEPGEQGAFYTYCPRHYVLTVAGLLENHDMHCDVSIWEHLRSYGRIDSPLQTGF